MKNNRAYGRLWACVAGSWLCSTLLVPASPSPFGGHYPIGVEGIKAATLPPPGLYLRDYNYFYYADRFRGGPPNFRVFAYAQAPRLIWITKQKILGAYYGMDVLIPFVYTDITLPGYKSSTFGMGDIYAEPIVLGWHGVQYDIGIGYAFWAPTGDYQAGSPQKPGKGFWSQMVTAGGTIYFDKQKTWAVSVLNRYEIHTQQQDTGITPGDTFVMEGGLSKALTKTIEVGAVWYYHQQTTADETKRIAYDTTLFDSVVGVGPEILTFCPKLGLFTSLRYLYELDAQDRPEGHTVVLTLTKRF